MRVNFRTDYYLVTSHCWGSRVAFSTEEATVRDVMPGSWGLAWLLYVIVWLY